MAFLRARLALAPHPEGGLYREHYRGQESARGSSSAIYFLMPEGSCSAWHRVNQDELWHHYEGAPVELHLIDDREGCDERCGYRVLRLGLLSMLLTTAINTPNATAINANACAESIRIACTRS